MPRKIHQESSASRSVQGALSSAPALKVATCTSRESDGARAIAEIAAKLQASSASLPDFITLHYGGTREVQPLWQAASQEFDGAALHGGSSFLGVMTDEGTFISDGDTVGAFAIWDPEGAYGTGMELLGDDARAAAASATKAALSAAGFPGEAPPIVWLTCAPSREEAILVGIKDVIGHPALIIGGTAGDNGQGGEWTQLSAGGYDKEAVVVSVMFCSTHFACAFENAYSPTPAKGWVTGAEGRVISTIDNRPAGEVYSEWTGGKITVPETGDKSILADTIMQPLGVKMREIRGVPYHLLSLPAKVHADGRLECYADVPEGNSICLMSSNEDTLVDCAERIAQSTLDQMNDVPVAGALFIYCAGCMSSVRDRVSEIAQGIARGLGGAPFLGIFTFGEQGEFVRSDSEHGNLMKVCLTFGETEPPYTSPIIQGK